MKNLNRNPTIYNNLIKMPLFQLALFFFSFASGLTFKNVQYTVNSTAMCIKHTNFPMIFFALSRL